MSFTAPASDYEVRKIKLSKEEQDKLLKFLVEEHNTVLDDRGSLEDKWKLWHLQANGRRKREDTSSERDSNIDIPTTREYMNQNAARIHTPILQQDQTMVAVPNEPRFQDLAKALEKYINYMLGRISIRTLMNEWTEQFQMFSAGFVKTSFVAEYEFVKRWVPVEEGEDVEVLERAGVRVIERNIGGEPKLFKEQDSKRKKRTGCFPETVPIEDMIFPPSSPDIYSAAWLTHRSWPSLQEIKFRVEEGIYNKEFKGKSVLDLIQKSDRERITFPVESPEESSPKCGKQYDIRETYLRWKVKGEEQEIIVTWEPKSQTLLCVTENYYHEYHRPFVKHCYKPVQGSIYGIPLTYVLEPCHVAYSASFNQRLDAGSLANETLIFGPPNSGLKNKYDAVIHGGFYETNATKDEIWRMDLGSPFTQLSEMENKLEEHMMKLSGLSDYSFGQEQVGRPTMGGTLQLVEESKHPQYLQLESFIESFSLMVRHMLARYKQFYPEGMIMYEYMSGKAEQSPFKQISVEWPEGAIEDAVVITTSVSSTKMSKNLRKQEILALVDKLPELYNTMGGFAMQAAMPNPQAPGGAFIAQSLLTGYQEVVNRFLDEFEIPNPQVINPPLVEEVQVASQVNTMVGQMQQQIDQLNNAVAGYQQQIAELTGQPPPGMGGGPVQQPSPQGPPPVA
jgi:hypothetical protein